MLLHQFDVETLAFVKHQSACVIIRSRLPIKSVKSITTAGFIKRGGQNSQYSCRQPVSWGNNPCPRCSCSLPSARLELSVVHISPVWSTAPSSPGQNDAFGADAFFPPGVQWGTAPGILSRALGLEGHQQLACSVERRRGGFRVHAGIGALIGTHVVSQAPTQAHHFILSYACFSPCSSDRTVQEKCVVSHVISDADVSVVLRKWNYT